MIESEKQTEKEGLEELTNIELRENVTILEKSSTSIDTKNSGNRRKCKLT